MGSKKDVIPTISKTIMVPDPMNGHAGSGVKKKDKVVSIAESVQGSDTDSELGNGHSHHHHHHHHHKGSAKPNTKLRRCRRRLSTLLHTHVALILVCSMAALDAAFVIGQIICDILIMKETLSEWEELDGNLSSILVQVLDHLNLNSSTTKVTLRDIRDHLLTFPGNRTTLGSSHEALALDHSSDTGLEPSLWQALQTAALRIPFSQAGTINVSVPGGAAGMEPANGSSAGEMVVGIFKIPLGRSRRAAGPQARAAAKGPGVGGNEALHHLTHTFHLGSMIILSILLAEALLKVFAMGKKVLHHKLEIFDAFVVSVSWALDVAFYEGIWAHPGTEAATILIFILPWRVVRIVNSFVLVIQEKDQVQLKIVKQRLRLSVKKSKESTRKASSYKTEVKQLQGLCRKYGASENEINACDPTGRMGRRRSSLMPAMERVASLTLISALGSHPSLYTLDSSSEEEEGADGSRAVRRTVSDNPTLRSALSVSTLDSVFTIEGKGDYDTESADELDSPIFKTGGDDDSPTPSTDSPLNVARLPHVPRASMERDMGRVQLSRRLHRRLMQQDSNASGVSETSSVGRSEGERESGERVGGGEGEGGERVGGEEMERASESGREQEGVEQQHQQQQQQQQQQQLPTKEENGHPPQYHKALDRQDSNTRL